MNCFNIILFSFAIFCSSAVYSSVSDIRLESVVQAIDGKNWNKAMNLLLEYEIENADVNLLWGVWYDGVDNPLRDPIKSRKSLEIAYKLGSREAQLLLIAKYLHAKDPNITNYKKGVELASDLAAFYEKKIKQGEDVDEELHRILGKFYLFGTGVDKNIAHGMQLINTASDLGDTEAKQIILKNR